LKLPGNDHKGFQVRKRKTRKAIPSTARLVLVEWTDSRQPEGQWRRLAELDHGNGSFCKCVSVGFLLRDNKDVKILAPNMADIDDPDNLQTAGTIVIPSRSVTAIKQLEEK
jgi:hypothetical protein